MTKINPFTGEAIDSTVRAKPKRKQFVKNARTDRKNPFALTNSEKMVLRELAEGFSNAEIAEFLSVSQRTIESHVSNMMSKLNCANRLELVVFSIRKGYIPFTLDEDF